MYNKFPVNEENSSLNYQIQTEDADKRLDVFLSENVKDWSRSRLQRLIEDEDVLVNGKSAKSSYKLCENDIIEVELIEQQGANFEPENIPLEIVYEDEIIAVVNKPAGMVVHPGAGISSGTLANALAFHFGMEKEDLEFENASSEQTKIQKLKSKIGMVHRLDKDTSGLIVIAKNELTQEKLAEQFRKRKVFKSYVALVHGEVRRESGKVEEPIARDKFNRLKMAVDKNGRAALSLWKVRQRFEKFTLLDVVIKSGRTHQIRVHLAFLNHPIVGDATYNEGRDNTISDTEIRRKINSFDRFFLHAEKLSFIHPKTNEKMNFTAPLPPELIEILRAVNTK